MKVVVYVVNLRTPWGAYIRMAFDTLEEAVVCLAVIIARITPFPAFGACVYRVVDGNLKGAEDVLPEAHKRLSEAIEKAKREGKRGRRK